MSHIDRVRALLEELSCALDQLESETGRAKPRPPRKVKPRRRNVARAIVEARRAARRST